MSEPSSPLQPFEAATQVDRWVNCPICKGQSLFAPRNRYRPFCSERCKNIDLGVWASESYTMPADSPPDDQVYGDPKLQ